MAVGAVNTVDVATQVSKPDANSVNYQSFLKLLVTQLQNQDPTNPADSSEYLSQLASFSSVEQAIQTNTKLDNLIAAMNVGIGAALVGKTVSVSGTDYEGIVRAVHMEAGSVSLEMSDGTFVPMSENLIVR